MRVLVTGGAGFIGSHVCTALRARGDQVRVLDCFDDSYDPALKRKNLHPEEELLEGDIRDAAVVDTALSGMDAVLHLAGRAGVRDSLSSPSLYASVNVLGTTVLLDGMRRRGVQRGVIASSSSVYGARRGGLFGEEDPVDHPESPYAASKAAMELFCRSGAAQGLHLVVARLFTVYGPRQRPNMAFQRFFSQLMARQPVTLYGDGTSLRDYTCVEDVVRGLILALDQDTPFEIVNFGGGQPVLLLEVVRTLAELLGVQPELEFLPEQPGDVPETRADIRKARDWLGWTPQVDLRTGLRRFVDSQR